MNTAFGVEVVYTFDSESDGGVFFWTLEEAKAYFEEMKTSVPKDNLQYAIDYMVLYKVESDKSALTSFCFADVVVGEECIEGWEWEDEDWPEENKSTNTNHGGIK